jgi:CheY-like chemotaxis protein
MMADGKQFESGRSEPIVLVVEDNTDLLESRLDNFAHHGIKGIGASSAEDAAAFLTSASIPVSLVLVDVNLRPHETTDRSGLALARHINNAMDQVPMIGYSGHFEPGTITSEERGLFDEWIPKGQVNMDQIDEHYAALARTVAERAERHIMDRSVESAGALAGFLAETDRIPDDRVDQSRLYLRDSLGVAPYDPLGGEEEPYDPLGGTPDGPSPQRLPDEVYERLMVVEPTVVES